MAPPPAITGEGSAPTGAKTDRKATRRWMLAPSSVELSLLYLFLGLHVAMGTDAVVPFSWLIALSLTMGFAGCWLGLRLVVFLLALFQGTRGVQWGRWVQVAFAVVFFFVIHATAWGFLVRTWISESVIREDVDRIQSAVEDGRIKLFKDVRDFNSMHIRMALFTEPQLEYVSDDGKTILWLTARGDAFFQPPFVWDGGLMYCESGKPPEDWSEFYVDHLYGPWWRWRMGD